MTYPHGSGWCCPDCGQQIYNSLPHTCPGFQFVPEPKYTAVLERIAKALEAIVEQLQRLADK